MARTLRIWSVEAGTVWDQPTTLLGPDNKTILDLSGADEVEAYFKYSAQDDDANARIVKTIGNGGVTVDDSAGGRVTIHFLPADTANVTGPSQVAYSFVVRAFLAAGPANGAQGKLFIVPSGITKLAP